MSDDWKYYDTPEWMDDLYYDSDLIWHRFDEMDPAFDDWERIWVEIGLQNQGCDQFIKEMKAQAQKMEEDLRRLRVDLDCMKELLKDIRV